jgi:hypothetical protein
MGGGPARLLKIDECGGQTYVMTTGAPMLACLQAERRDKPERSGFRVAHARR